MTYKPLLGLSTVCGACAFVLLLLNDFEGALLAAAGGVVLYVAHETIRVRVERDDP